MNIKPWNTSSGSKIKNMKYKHVIMLVSVVIASIFLIVAALQSYYSTMGYIKSKTDSINIGIVQQTANTIESNLDQIERLNEYIATDNNFFDLFDKYNKSTYGEKPLVKNDIKSAISILKQYNEYIQDIVVITDDVVINTENSSGIYNLRFEAVKDHKLIRDLENKTKEKLVFFLLI